MTSPVSEPPAMDLGADEREQSMEEAHYKSYRKKWRKLRVRFDRAMDNANENFIREDKIWETARRLQEQNDQILEILHDLELDAFPEKHSDEDRKETVPEAWGYGELANNVTHTKYPIKTQEETVQLPSDLQGFDESTLEDAVPPGYLSFEHEIAYLEALDTALAARAPPDNLPPTLEAISMPSDSQRQKRPLRETDFAQKYPYSSHNWLRRYQPNLYVEKPVDKHSERSGQSPAPMSKKAKKKAATEAAKEKDKEKLDQPYESLDEHIGYDAGVDNPAAGKGKRKRLTGDDGDDYAYRPKGGGSRLKKTKKADAKKSKLGEGSQEKIEDEVPGPGTPTTDIGDT